METTIISALVGLFCTAASTLITFFLTRKKYGAEVKSQKLKNVESEFELHRKMTNDSIKMQNDKIQQLQEENANLRKQVDDLRQQMVDMLSTICLDITCKARKVGFPPGISPQALLHTTEPVDLK